jgi:hypothetical protein
MSGLRRIRISISVAPSHQRTTGGGSNASDPAQISNVPIATITVANQPE